MKKKPTVFIRDGQVRSYEDPLRRLAPVEKMKSTKTKEASDSNEVEKKNSNATPYSKETPSRGKKRPSYKALYFICVIVLINIPSDNLSMISEALTEKLSMISELLTEKLSTIVRLSTEELSKEIRKEMSKNFRAENLDVKIADFNLVHKSGNIYTGILETIEPEGKFSYDVEVIYDGNSYKYTIKP